MPQQALDEEVIFQVARRIGLPEVRAAYLDQVCGADRPLHDRVLALLGSPEEDAPFLEAPPSACLVEADATTDQRLVERPGTQIGPYKLLQQIGEGGMGVVYMAEQTEPIARRVALKVIKAGMDTRQVIARFEAERQALAMMDHVNIARVLDAGTTPTPSPLAGEGWGEGAGRPYFVMELVNGVPITKYCDDNHLTPRQRLELFVPVCQAIQHAHQKGIIHRDIKPSNVMVTLYDGKPVPKVIDFGVAKAIEQKLTERTLFTQYGTMVGTLEYMSPEQAEMSGLGVDTRSDIYSLGVLLYELLTGNTPLSHKTMKEAAYAEILRMIKEEEPPKPSTRLSDSGEALASISANRHTEPAKLSKLMRGELDWIVMKTLEKDRNRRYETAKDFAADVQRYLDDEHVQACPPSAGYRLRKFARRNKVGVAVGALVLCFLVLLGSGVGWTLRDRAARQSRIGAQVDLILGEALQLEQEQKWPEALAVARRAEALTAGRADAATQEQVRQVLHDLQMLAGLEELRLREARGAGAGASFDEGHPRLYAAAFRNFGVDVETLPAEESAARLRARPAVAVALAAALDDWARTARQRDPEQSKRLWTLAAAVDPDPWRVSVRQAVAAGDVDSLMKLANAPDTARQPPQSQLLLASSLRRWDRPEQSLALLERACEIHPDDFRIHFALEYENRAIRPARLEAAVRHGFAARALRPQSAATWMNLGNALMDQKKLDDAIACHKKAIDLDPKYAAPHINLGAALYEQKKLAEAIHHHRQAIELDPNHAAAHNNLGLALSAQKKLAEAFACYKQAIKLDPNFAGAYNNLGNLHRDEYNYRSAIECFGKAIELDPKDFSGHNNLGNVLFDQDKLDEAIAAYRQAIALNAQFAGGYHNLGVVLSRQNKLDEAVAAFRQAIDLDTNHSGAYYNLGLALSDQKKLDEAIAAYRQAIALDPKLAAAYNDLGVALSEQKKLDEAIAAYRQAIELSPKFLRPCVNLASALLAQGKADEAVALCRQAIEIDPNSASTYVNLGNALQGQKKLDEAIAAFRKAIELNPKYAAAHGNLGGALHEQKKLDEAINAYRQAIELDPISAPNYVGLGNTLRNQKKLEEAIAAYKKAIELDPHSAVAYSNLGALLCDELKDSDQAIECFRQAITIDPEYADAKRNLGIALSKKGWGLANSPDPKLRDLKRAVELANEAVEIAPHLSQGLQWLGWIQYRAGNWTASIEALEKSCKLQPGGTGDFGQWIVLALAHARLAAQEGLPEQEREHHRTEARRWFDQADKQIEGKWRVRPGHAMGQDIWDFRDEARELLKKEE